LPYDFTLAGIPLFREAETEHILVCGAPGSGKGVAIKELLDQIRARGDRAILYDPSGEEYVPVYYRHGRNVLVNPLDARSRPWTLWGDVREAYDYASLAASIIPESERVNDPFWREGPRGLFEAVALRLAERGEATNAAFRHMIAIAPLSELFGLVKGTEAAPAIDPAAEKMAIGVRATVSTKIRAWAYLPDPEPLQKPFSVRRFIEDEGGDAWLFLTSRRDQHAFLRPLLSLWCDQAAASILSSARSTRPADISIASCGSASHHAISGNVATSQPRSPRHLHRGGYQRSGRLPHGEYGVWGSAPGGDSPAAIASPRLRSMPKYPRIPPTRQMF